MGYLAGWKNRIKLTVDGTKIESTMSHFPILIKLNSGSGLNSFDSTRVFDELGADSLKLAVTYSDGITELYVEVVKWDHVGEQAILWVGLAGGWLYAGVDNIFYLYYDSTHADNSVHVGVVGSTPAKNVWDALYKEVLHLPDGADTGHVTGSVTGTSYSKKAANEPLEVTGKVGEAQQFDGTDDYINLGTPGFTTDQEGTIEAVIKPTAAAGAILSFSKPSTGAVDEIYFRVETTYRIEFVAVLNSVLSVDIYTGNNVLANNVWNHVAVRSDGSTLEILKDGVVQSVGGSGNSGQWFGDAVTDADTVTLGLIRRNSSATSRFAGIIDELRVSDSKRSDAWLKATYYACWDQLITFSIEGTDQVDVRVQIAFGSDPLDASYTWTDVSDDVREVHASHGRNHQLDRMEAGTATVVLLNLDEEYWPDNAGGSYYPNVKVMKPINIKAIWDGGIYDAFTGFIESWEPGWLEEGGYGSIMTLQCVDALKILAQQVINAGSGYSAELSGTRVGNVLVSISWPAAKRDIDTGAETMQATGALVNENALEHAQKVQESELSLLYVAPNGNIQYEDRSHRTSSPHDTSQATFGDDAGELPYSDLKYILDDVLLFNEARMTRTGGSEQTASNTDSQTAYGKRSLVRSGLLNNSDLSVELLCNYVVARQADIVGRAESMAIKPSPSNSLWPQALGREISDRITVRLNEASLDKDYFIEKVTHDWLITEGEYDTEYQISDATQYFYEPDAKEETLRPNGAGSLTGLTPSVGANWECVDEETKDDDTTYVKEPGSDATDLYALEDSAVGAGTINSVTIHAWARETIDAAADGYCVLKVRTHSITYTGGNISLTTSYQLVSTVYTTNPNTGAPWTWAEVAALEIGIELQTPLTAGSPDGEARCTQAYAVVNFTPAW